MRAVEVQGAAAQEDAALGFGNCEVPDVLADLGVVPAQQGAVAGERVHQIEDVYRVLQLRLAHRRPADARDATTR